MLSVYRASPFRKKNLSPPPTVSTSRSTKTPTQFDFCSTVNLIGGHDYGKRPKQRQADCSSAALAEGSSIRAIERMTGVHRDTIMRLGVRVGQGCARLLDEKMRNLDCRRIELDEIWGFIGKKKANVSEYDDPTYGDVWTYCAIDAETKLVPAYKVASRRNVPVTIEFISDLKSRLNNRIQMSSDAMRSYGEAVDTVFGTEVDYAQIVKTYGTDESKYSTPERKYSPSRILSSEKVWMQGQPVAKYVSTSYVERV